MLYRDGFELGTVLKMSPLKWDVSQPPKMFIAKDIIHKSQWYQISRYNIVHYIILHIVLLISQLPNIIKRCFCTPNGAMNLTFQM